MRSAFRQGSMVALYRVIVALRTQGAVRRTYALRLHNQKCLLERGRYVKKASLSPIGRLRVVAETWMYHSVGRSMTINSNNTYPV